MKFILTTLCIAILLCAGTAHAQVSDSYNDVLLLVNDASSNSTEIASFFASRRNIPAYHQYHFTADTSETMDSVRFTQLRWNLQSWMKQRKLVDSINYIVTTKGCPLRVTVSPGSQGLSSFEDCLVLMNGSDSGLILSDRQNLYGSRYYGSTDRFQRSAALPMYLVTRLDAYTVDQIKSYIQRAEQPVAIGDGLWFLDIDPGRDGDPGYKVCNDWMRDAYSILTTKGMNVVMNTDTTYVHGLKNVVGYYSWGSNDGHSGGGAAAKPGNTWVNGSIAETAVSTGGRSFTPGTGYGQSLVADILAEGACAVKGYTDEPYLVSIAHADILFDRYTSGWTMAESFYAASQLIAWRQVVVGDPKMRLGVLMVASETSLDFGAAFRYTKVWDTLYVRNTSGVQLLVDSIRFGGTGVASFAVVAPTQSFVLQPNDSVGIMLSYAPHSYSAEDAYMTVYHRRLTDTKPYPLNITLTGTGKRPDLITPRLTDYGKVLINNTVDMPLTLTNGTTTDTITVTALALGGANAARFTISPASLSALPKIIPPGASWDVTVAYTPTGEMLDTATLNVSSNATVLSKRLAMRGNGATSGINDRGTISTLDQTAITSLAPNPFSETLHFGYRIAEERTNVRMEVMDITGRVVAVIEGGMQNRGEHVLHFTPRNLPNGTYLCRLTATNSHGERVTSQYPVVYLK